MYGFLHRLAGAKMTEGSGGWVRRLKSPFQLLAFCRFCGYWCLGWGYTAWMPADAGMTEGVRNGGGKAVFNSD